MWTYLDGPLDNQEWVQEITCGCPSEFRPFLYRLTPLLFPPETSSLNETVTGGLPLLPSNTNSHSNDEEENLGFFPVPDPGPSSPPSSVISFVVSVQEDIGVRFPRPRRRGLHRCPLGEGTDRSRSRLSLEHPTVLYEDSPSQSGVDGT